MYTYHDSFESKKFLLISKQAVSGEPVERFLIQPPTKDPSFLRVRLLWETGRPQFLFAHCILQLFFGILVVSGFALFFAL